MSKLNNVAWKTDLTNLGNYLYKALNGRFLSNSKIYLFEDDKSNYLLLTDFNLKTNTARGEKKNHLFFGNSRMMQKLIRILIFKVLTRWKLFKLSCSLIAKRIQILLTATVEFIDKFRKEYYISNVYGGDTFFYAKLFFEKRF